MKRSYPFYLFVVSLVTYICISVAQTGLYQPMTLRYLLWTGSFAVLVAFGSFVTLATRYFSSADLDQYPLVRNTVLSELLLVVVSSFMFVACLPLPIFIAYALGFS